MYCRGILDAHWHHDPFIEPPRRIYRREVDIIWVHARLEKAIGHVKGGKNFALAEACKYFIDSGDGETICDRVAV